MNLTSPVVANFAEFESRSLHTPVAFVTNEDHGSRILTTDFVKAAICGDSSNK